MNLHHTHLLSESPAVEDARSHLRTESLPMKLENATLLSESASLKVVSNHLRKASAPLNRGSKHLLEESALVEVHSKTLLGGSASPSGSRPIRSASSLAHVEKRAHTVPDHHRGLLRSRDRFDQKEESLIRNADLDPLRLIFDATFEGTEEVP